MWITQNRWELQTVLFKFRMRKMFCKFDSRGKSYLTCVESSYFDALLSLDKFRICMSDKKTFHEIQF